MSKTQIQSGDIADGAVGSPQLANTGVSGGTYTSATIRVNDKGQIISATSNTAFTGTIAPAAITPQGSGSTLNADMLDGKHASQFASPAHTHDHGTLTGLGDDDHPQYQLLTAKNSPGGYVGLAVSGYVSPSRLGSGYASGKALFGNTWTSPVTGVTDHGMLTGLNPDNDHPQYQLVAGKDAASGYAGLDVSGLIGITHFALSPAAGKILYGNQTWASPDHGTLLGLSDDDHTQYHTDARALTWLRSKSISELSDVSPGTPTNNQVLTWNAASSQWKSQSPTAGGVTDHGALTGLSDDDHPQYLTSPRASSWLGTKSIYDLQDVSPSGALAPDDVLTWNGSVWLPQALPEPSIYTNEDAQDAVGSILTNSSTIKFTYNDAGNTITAAVSPAGVSHASLANLTSGDPHTQYQLESEKNTANGYAGLGATNLISPLHFAANPAAGKVLYGDSTWASPVVYTSFTNELAQDAVGGALTNTATVKWTYNDGSNTISADVSPAGINHASLANLTVGDPHTQYHTDTRADAWLSPKKFAPSKISPQGTGSGLDADTLDGSHAAAFALSGHTHTLVALTDVSPGTPTTGQVLTYNSSSGQWYSASPTTYTSFTTELAQDAVGGALTNTSTIKFTYNDGANTISADVSPANISHANLSNLTVGDPHTQYQQESEKNQANGYAGLDATNLISPTHFAATPAAGKVLYGNSTWASPDHGTMLGLSDDDHTQYHNDSRARTWLSGGGLSWLGDVSPTTPTNGQVLTYNGTSTQWYNASPIVYVSFTNELAQDAVGGALTNTATIKFTYNDGANTISADVSPAGISHANLANLTVGDPHTQYQQESEKNQANGYPGLGATNLISPTHFAATPAAGKVLYGDSTWASPTAASISGLGALATKSTITGAYIDAHTVSPGRLTGTQNNVILGVINGIGVYDITEITCTVFARTLLDDTSASNARTTLGLGTIATTSPGGVSHAALSNLTVGDPHTQYQLVSGKNVANGYAGLGATNLISPIHFAATPAAGKVLYGDSTWASPTVYTSFTNELAQDAVGNALTNTATIKWTYNDGANTISADVSPAGISHANLANLTTGDPHTQYQLESEKNTANGYAGLTAAGIVSPTRLAATPAAGKLLYGDSTWASPVSQTMVFSDTDFTVLESPANTFNISLIGGGTTLAGLTDVSPTAPTTGQVLTYNGTSGQWYNASPSVGGYTNEMAQDAVGGILTGTSTIKWTYNDAGNTISADVSPAGLTSYLQAVSGKNAANGYAGLGATSLISPTHFAATPVAGKVLYGNQTWASPDHGTLLGLSDDDHTQYHTDARALTWLQSKGIDELSDVSPTVGKADGDVLTWNSTSSKWTNEAPTGGSGLTQAQVLARVSFRG